MSFSKQLEVTLLPISISSSPYLRSISLSSFNLPICESIYHPLVYQLLFHLTPSFFLCHFRFTQLLNSHLFLGASYLKDFIQAGIKHFRVEFVDERPEDVLKIINMYQDICQNIKSADNFNKIENEKYANTHSSAHSSGPSSAYGSNSNTNSNTNTKNIADRNLESSLMTLWKFLEIVPNGHGLPQGVSLGSLKPTQERNWDTLRPTAKR